MAEEPNFLNQIGSSLGGLLGFGSSSAQTTGGPQDIMSMLSEDERKRLTYSALGQLGASLLAAGQKQMPSQRAQYLAQLGNIGPNMDLQMQRAVAVRNQQEALRRQNELFPLQKQQLQGQITAQQNQAALFPLQQQQIEGGLAAQRQQLAMQQRQAAIEIVNLQRQIRTMEEMGLDASGVRQQLQVAQQYMGGTAGSPAPSIAPPTMPTAPAGTVGQPAPAGSTPAASAGQSMSPAATAPSMAPYAPSQAVSEAGYGGAAGQQASMGFQRVLSQLPYLSPDVVRSSLAQGGDLTKTMAELYKENEKAKQELFKFEGDLRDKYMPKAEKFADMQQTYKSMIDLSKEQTGVSDIMLVVQLYKLFDPGSVVSVNETGQVTSASSGVERAQAFIDRFLTGGKLTDTMRQEVLDTARAKFAQGYKDYNLGFDAASKRAAEYGASMPRAVPDVRDPEIKPLMDKIVKMPVTRQVNVGNGPETAKLGIDGRYYVIRDKKREPIEFGE